MSAPRSATKRFGRALRGVGWWSVPLLAYGLIAVSATHPLWLHLASAVPSDIGDPLLNTWILAWDVRALTIHPLNLFEANIFFPLPGTLAYSEHLLGNALVALPLLLFTGEPVVAYNLSFLLSFILGGWGTYLLARRYTHNGWAAFLAGLAFSYAPYRLTSFSHLQLLTLQWLPFSLLCLEGMLRPCSSCRSKRSGTIALTVAFVVLLWLQIITSWHLAVFTVFTIGIFMIGSWFRLARKQRATGLVRAVVALLAVALLTWPLVPPYLDVIAQLSVARPIEIAAGFGAWPSDYVTASPWNRLFGSLTSSLAGRPLFTEENFMFIGVVSPLLALVGLWHVLRRRASDHRSLVIATTWLVIGLGAWVLSWGPFLNGVAQTIPLPYYFLSRLSSIFGLIRVPPRWMIATVLPAAVLVGYGGRAILGVHRLTSIFRTILFALLAVALVAESWSVPLPLAPVGTTGELPSVYHWLAAQPGDFGIVEWPIYVAPRPEYPETKRLYASTVHWKSLVNGYSGFTPERQTALDAELVTFPDARSLQALRDLGQQNVRYLIVHTLEQDFDRLRWKETDRWVLDRSTTTLPVFEAQGDVVYEINPWGDAWITKPATILDGRWRARSPHAANVRWRDGLICLAYQKIDTAGDVIYVDFYWQREAPFPRGVSVFVHLLNDAGNIIAQGDGPMVGGHFPTPDWSPDEVVQDRHLLVPLEAADVSTGTHLRVGLYYPQTGERLSVFNEEGLPLGDHVLLPWEETTP